MIRVAWEGTDGLAWLESDSRFHGPVGSGRVGVGRRSEGASAKAMPATALNAPWHSTSLATVSTSGGEAAKSRSRSSSRSCVV